MRNTDKRANNQKLISKISAFCLILLITYFCFFSLPSKLESTSSSTGFQGNLLSEISSESIFTSQPTVPHQIISTFLKILKILPVKNPWQRRYSETPIFLQNNERQKIFRFRDLNFSSQVESGSVASVKKLRNRRYLVHIISDVVINQSNEEKRNWFFFKVSGVKKAQKIKISVRNLNYNWSMWKHGLVPVIRSSSKEEYRQWKLFDLGEVTLVMKKGQLQLDFEYSLDLGEEVEVALTFPYTMSHLNSFIKEYAKKLKRVNQGMFLHKETLIRSNLGNPVDVYWIGKQSNKGMRIPKLKNLFPDIKQNSKRTKIPQRKCNVLISARVHPSETASNYMLEGFLNSFIQPTISTGKFFKSSSQFVSDNSNSKWSLINKMFNLFPGFPKNISAPSKYTLSSEMDSFFDRCNLVVVPMLNPDGVVNGLTRTDINGINLNNHYSHADLDTPSIYALKKLVKWYHQKKQLNFYFDFHSHFTKRGAFLFGNPLKDKNFDKVLLLPYFFNKFEKEFSVKESKFGSIKSESTSRKEITALTKINKVYTIEVNYWGKKMKMAKLRKKNLVNYNLRKVKGGKGFYEIKDFHRIGKNLAKALLGYFQMRSMSKAEKLAIHKGVEKLYKTKQQKKKKRKKKKTKKKQKKKTKLKTKKKTKKKKILKDNKKKMLPSLRTYSLNAINDEIKKTIIYQNEVKRRQKETPKPKSPTEKKQKILSLKKTSDSISTNLFDETSIETNHKRIKILNQEELFSGTMSAFNNAQEDSQKSKEKSHAESTEIHQIVDNKSQEESPKKVDRFPRGEGVGRMVQKDSDDDDAVKEKASVLRNQGIDFDADKEAVDKESIMSMVTESGY